MRSNKEKVALGGIIILVIVGVSFAVWKWRPANTPDHPDGVAWLCQSPGCGQPFKMSVREYDAYKKANYGQPLKCPKCGKTETVRAQVCPKCQKTYPLARGAGCPSCNKQQPPAPEG